MLTTLVAIALAGIAPVGLPPIPRPGKPQQPNPHVPYRVPTNLAVTGNVQPISTIIWEVMRGQYVVASNEDTNGWHVSYTAPSTLTVSSPYGVGAAPGLEVRYNASGVGKSAAFDLVPQGVKGGILDIWIGQNNQQNPSNPGSYTIYKGGNVIDTGGSNGWLQTWVGPHGELLPQPFHIAITIPSGAALGTDYEWRASDSLDTLPVPQHYSSFFDVVATTFGFPIDIQPDPPFGFLAEPMVLVPWMEDLKPSDAPDSPGNGPASAFSVDLVHGGLEASKGLDVVASNSKGPDVPFGLRFRSPLSAGNLSSPGLPPGWTHNWDYRIVSFETGSPRPVGGGGGGDLVGLFASLMPAQLVSQFVV